MGKASEVIMKCLEENGIRQSELARRMGVDVRNLNQKLHRQKDIKYEDFEFMMECIGYSTAQEQLDIGAYRIGASLVEDIRRTGEPTGKFWYDHGGEYIGIVNFGGEIKIETFTRKEVLFGWLERDGAMPWEAEKNQ